jgi:hypothetical protein
MNRTAWLEDRPTPKFRDVLSRWERGELSMMQAGEFAGVEGASVSLLPGSLRGGWACRARRPSAREGVAEASTSEGGVADTGAVPGGEFFWLWDLSNGSALGRSFACLRLWRCALGISASRTAVDQSIRTAGGHQPLCAGDLRIGTRVCCPLLHDFGEPGSAGPSVQGLLECRTTRLLGARIRA